MNNIYNHNNAQGGQNINSNVSNVSEGSTVKKSLMKNISIAIVLLVVIYGGYSLFVGQPAEKEVVAGINTSAESYVLLNDLTSKLNFKNSEIVNYSFDWNEGKYNGYAISAISFVGVAESPFNEELKNSGFVEEVNNLAEGKIAGISVYSKDGLVCIIKNDAVNPNSWGTDNPDYSSTQTFACASKSE